MSGSKINSRLTGWSVSREGADSGTGCDAHRKTAMQLGITSIPTVILFKDGVEMQRFVGIQPVEVLSMAIEMILVKHKK